MTILKDEVMAAHIKHIENCYLIRDTITFNKKTQLLWALIKQICNIREAEVLSDMRDTLKSQAQFDNEGNQIGYKKVAMTAEDFHKLAGVSEGLRYAAEKVDEMVAKANREDAIKKDAERDKESV